MQICYNNVIVNVKECESFFFFTHSAHCDLVIEIIRNKNILPIFINTLLLGSLFRSMLNPF